MVGDKLKFGGEFRDSAIEQAFTVARHEETLRQCRLLFLLSAALNTLFLLSDWRFAGTPHFFIAVPARLSVVMFSLLCFLMVRRTTDLGRALAATLLWEATTAVAVAFLVSSRSDLALFVVLLLLFGARKLPEIAHSLGRALEEFRRSAREFRDEVMNAVDAPPGDDGKPHDESTPQA